MQRAHGRALISAARTLPLLLLPCAVANASDQSFTSYARDLKSGKLLYVESHYVRNASQLDESRVVLYRCSAGGPAFARKELSYGATREEPQFNYLDARSGYTEGLRRTTAGLQVFQRDSTRQPIRQAAVPANVVMVADAGFDEFVRQHWADLLVPHRSAELLVGLDRRGNCEDA